MVFNLILGDCLLKLKELEDNSIDSVVTDSPYGISFMGSGSTGKAAVLEGFSFIGVELSEEYLKIAIKRIDHALNSNKNIITLKL